MEPSRVILRFETDKDRGTKDFFGVDIFSIFFVIHELLNWTIKVYNNLQRVIR